VSDREKIGDYREAVLAAKFAANLLVAHDIAGILDAIERADAVGPIMDPTLYREKVGAMHEDRDLLRAALQLQAFGTPREPG
jgi:hypothetical protein